MRDHRVPLDVLQRYQRQMIEAHASGIGPPLDSEDVRAAMLARVSGAARGGSGLTLEAVRAARRDAERGRAPDRAARRLGRRGRPHAHGRDRRVMIGRGEAEFDGELLPGGVALARGGPRADRRPAQGRARAGELQRRRDRRRRARGRGGAAARAPRRPGLRALARGHARQPGPLGRGRGRRQGDPGADRGGGRGARAARGLLPATTRTPCSRCRIRSRSGSRPRSTAPSASRCAPPSTPSRSS